MQLLSTTQPSSTAVHPACGLLNKDLTPRPKYRASPCPQDRIDSLAERAINWATLTKKRNCDKKLAVTVFSFPPDKGNVGTAAYLNVFGSIYRVLKVPACLVAVGCVSRPLKPHQTCRHFTVWCRDLRRHISNPRYCTQTAEAVPASWCASDVHIGLCIG